MCDQFDYFDVVAEEVPEDLCVCVLGGKVGGGGAGERERTSLERRRESITNVPVRALRSAERWPMYLALEASRLPMAFPTRVDAAMPGEKL